MKFKRQNNKISFINKIIKKTTLSLFIITIVILIFASKNLRKYLKTKLYINEQQTQKIKPSFKLMLLFPFLVKIYFGIHGIHGIHGIREYHEYPDTENVNEFRI